MGTGSRRIGEEGCVVLCSVGKCVLRCNALLKGCCVCKGGGGGGQYC